MYKQTTLYYCYHAIRYEFLSSGINFITYSPVIST